MGHLRREFRGCCPLLSHDVDGSRAVLLPMCESRFGGPGSFRHRPGGTEQIAIRIVLVGRPIDLKNAYITGFNGLLGCGAAHILIVLRCAIIVGEPILHL